MLSPLFAIYILLKTFILDLLNSTEFIFLTRFISIATIAFTSASHILVFLEFFLPCFYCLNNVTSKPLVK